MEVKGGTYREAGSGAVPISRGGSSSCASPQEGYGGRNVGVHG
jgi:hypothetical protein